MWNVSGNEWCKLYVKTKFPAGLPSRGQSAVRNATFEGQKRRCCHLLARSTVCNKAVLTPGLRRQRLVKFTKVRT